MRHTLIHEKIVLSNRKSIHDVKGNLRPQKNQTRKLIKHDRNDLKGEIPFEKVSVNSIVHGGQPPIKPTRQTYDFKNRTSPQYIKGV